MSHEPDCPLSTIDSDVDTKDCVFCPIVRAAYWRGRDDAANAVVRVPRWQYPDHADNRWVIDAEDACSAARWDGAK